MRGGRYRSPPGSAAPGAHALVVLEDDPRELVRRGPRQRVEVERQGAAVVVGAQDGGSAEDGVALLPRGESEPDPRARTGQLAAEIADEHPALADVQRSPVELLARGLCCEHHGGGEGRPHVLAAAQELVRRGERKAQRTRGELRRLLKVAAYAMDAVVGHVLDGGALSVKVARPRTVEAESERNPGGRGVRNSRADPLAAGHGDPHLQTGRRARLG